MIDHFKNELELAGLFNKDSDYGGMLGECVLELLTVFEKQGHSGFSAQMTANIFHKLLKENILSPLTGNDDEWVLHDEDPNKKYHVYQNKRRSSVFKTIDGSDVYDIDGGPIFKDINGNTYTCKESILHNIKFPYSLKEREVIDDYCLIKEQRFKLFQEFIDNNPLISDNKNAWGVGQELMMWSSIATWDNKLLKNDFDHIVLVRNFDDNIKNYLLKALDYMGIKIVEIDIKEKKDDICQKEI